MALSPSGSESTVSREQDVFCCSAKCHTLDLARQVARNTAEIDKCGTRWLSDLQRGIPRIVSGNSLGVRIDMNVPSRGEVAHENPRAIRCGPNHDLITLPESPSKPVESLIGKFLDSGILEMVNERRSIRDERKADDSGKHTYAKWPRILQISENLRAKIPMELEDYYTFVIPSGAPIVPLGIYAWNDTHALAWNLWTKFRNSIYSKWGEDYCEDRLKNAVVMSVRKSAYTELILLVEEDKNESGWTQSNLECIPEIYRVFNTAINEEDDSPALAIYLEKLENSAVNCR